MTAISLPWPSVILSPNQRGHWAKKNDAAQKLKRDCLLILSQHKKELRGKSQFKFTFRPPDYRVRDIDNLIASIKAMIDAISMTAGVDDSQFVMTFSKLGMVKGGAVEVAIVG